MLLLIAGFLVSLVPSLAVYFMLKGLRGDPWYKDSCRAAFKRGVLTVFPIVLLSFAFNVIEHVSGLFEGDALLQAAFHKFIVLALAEELAKFLMFRRHLGKLDVEYSWLDMISFMTIIGLAFGLAEDVVFAFGTSPGQMIVRGITAGHLGYGFVMGYFMGKGRKTGNKVWTILGFALPWLMHGAYDFGLSDEFLALGEDTAFLSVSLAFLDFVLLIVTVVFALRARKNPTYTEQLPAE